VVLAVLAFLLQKIIYLKGRTSTMMPISANGRIVRDFELRTSNSGCVYVNFSLAVNEGFGEKKKPIFFECTAFGPVAERLVKAKAKKGSLIHVSGEFGTQEFTRKNGEPGYSLKITVHGWSYVPVASGQKDANGANGGNDASTNNAQNSNQGSDQYYPDNPAEYYPEGDYHEETNLDDETYAA